MDIALLYAPVSRWCLASSQGFQRKTAIPEAIGRCYVLSSLLACVPHKDRAQRRRRKTQRSISQKFYGVHQGGVYLVARNQGFQRCLRARPRAYCRYEWSDDQGWLSGG